MAAEPESETRLAAFEAALPVLRPELHRYCARMTGSVVDGEDVLQDALFSATRAMSAGAAVGDMRAWLFRIAHNTALNHFRARKRELAMKEAASQTVPTLEQAPMRSDTTDALRPFLALSPKQRSTVILKDVLGYSASEIAELTDSSVEAVKSALHRGRIQLKDHQPDEEAAPALLTAEDRQRLARYAACFNAHEFDRLRDMLSAEVRLELVSRERREGKAGVGDYYTNYSRQKDWLMAPGSVEGRPAILAFDRNDPSGPPGYFILLEFDGADLSAIRDFRYARYAMDDARWERF